MSGVLDALGLFMEGLQHFRDTKGLFMEGLQHFRDTKGLFMEGLQHFRDTKGLQLQKHLNLSSCTCFFIPNLSL